MTVCDVCADLARHPVRRLIRQWHWKGAALAAILRGGVFFATNLAGGLDLAIRAVLVDSAFRIPLAGTLTAVTQAFLYAEPRWAASLAAMGLVPVFAHAVELLVHWNAGTPELGISMLASIGVSAVSTFFNLFAMRRGLLIVGDASRPFADDVKRLPRTIIDFVLALPRALAVVAVRTRSWHAR